MSWNADDERLSGSILTDAERETVDYQRLLNMFDPVEEYDVVEGHRVLDSFASDASDASEASDLTTASLKSNDIELQRQIRKRAQELMRPPSKKDMDTRLKFMESSAIRMKFDDAEIASATRSMMHSEAADFEHLTGVFCKFVGAFGTFMKVAAKNRALDAIIAQSTILESADVKRTVIKHWMTATIGAFAGRELALTATATDHKIHLPDEEMLKYAEAQDIDKRMHGLAIKYMEVRWQCANDVVGHNASDKAAAARRYEVWMYKTFPGWYQNFFADWTSRKLAQVKLARSVEMFMMETLFKIFTMFVNQVTLIAEYGERVSEPVRIGTVISNVQQGIQTMFESFNQIRADRNDNITGNIAMFAGSALALSALMTVFIVVPNPPALIGTMTFMMTVGKNSAISLVQEMVRYEADVGAHKFADQVLQTLDGISASHLFKRMLPDLIEAAGIAKVGRTQIGRQRWMNGGSSAAGCALAWSALAAVVAIMAGLKGAL